MNEKGIPSGKILDNKALPTVVSTIFSSSFAIFLIFISVCKDMLPDEKARFKSDSCSKDFDDFSRSDDIIESLHPDWRSAD